MKFLDTDDLARRRMITKRIHYEYRWWLDNQIVTPAEVKQTMLNFRARGVLDDEECEGLIERLGLQAS